MRKIVQVNKTANGLFMPIMMWGQGESMDREAYWDQYRDLEVAERAAKNWAEERGAEHIPYKEFDHEASKKQAALVRKLREEKGLDLRTAIQQARAQLRPAAA